MKVIYEYTRQAVEFLFHKGARLIILACNTASAKALRKIQQDWLPVHYPERRVLGVVIPLAEEAVETSRFGRIGVVGTRATIESRVFEQELLKLGPDLKIYTRACPLLAQLVEENWVGKPETNMILKKYLRPLKSTHIDTLILGCTHYPFLKKDIQRIMGRNCHVLDAPGVVALKLADYLHRHPEIEQSLAQNSQYSYFTTDDAYRFKDLGEKFLKRRITKVQTILLE